MKFLENVHLETLSNRLEGAELGGGLLLHGRIETYSTKKSTEEKKEAKSLETVMVTGVSEENKRTRLYVDLIQTLSAANQDLDFSHLTGDSFRTMSLGEAQQHINAHLSELTVSYVNSSLLSEFWSGLNVAMSNELSRCEVFTLLDPSAIDDPEDGVVWAFHYFFCNKDLRRIAYVHCNAVSRYRPYGFDQDSDVEEEDEIMMDESEVDDEDDDEFYDMRSV